MGFLLGMGGGGAWCSTEDAVVRLLASMNGGRKGSMKEMTL